MRIVKILTFGIFASKTTKTGHEGKNNKLDTAKQRQAKESPNLNDRRYN